MLEVQVPKAFISSLQVRELRSGRDWKESMELPSKYDEYCLFGGAGIRKGHICKRESHIITKIKKTMFKVVWARREQRRNQSGRPKGYSVGFHPIEEQLSFAREINGKIYVEITPPAISIASTVNK